MTPQTLAGEVTHLFTLPDLVMRACAVMDSPSGSARDLVEIIELDAGLAATVLRLANSALYGHPGRVETLSHAVAIIGHKALRDLMLATSAVKTFRDIPPEFVDMDSFWDNSITSGVFAKLLARRLRMADAETLFIAGLLLGVGRLVFYARRPAEYREVLRLARADQIDPVVIERRLFGFSYAELGAALLEAWKLPEKLRVAVRHHLEPAGAPGFEREVAITHLASLIGANLAPCLKPRREPEPYLPDSRAEAAMRGLGLDDQALEALRLETLEASLEVIEIIHPGATTVF